MFRKIMAHFGSNMKYAVLTPILILGEVVIEVIIPLIMAKIVDVGIGGADTPYVIRMGVLMIVMATTSLVFGAIAGRTAALAGTGLSRNLRRAMFAKVQDFSFSNVDKFSTASLITRLTTDINNTQMAVIMGLKMIFRAPLMLVCAMIMATSINSDLAGVFFAAIPLLGTGLFVIVSRAFPLFQSMLGRYDKLNGIVQENLIAIRTVKAYVREDHESEKFRDIANQVLQKQAGAERTVAVMMPLMQFAMYGCMIAIAWFGGNKIMAGHMLTGELMSFISYTGQILMSLMMISFIVVQLVISKASITRISEVLSEEPGIAEKPEAAGVIEDGAIRFENVSFSYSGKTENPVLDQINLEIKSGETIGILGGTGSAKTTFVQLIPRLYDVVGGAVYVGGRDVRDYGLRPLRDAVAMVLQKNVLFSGTIAENLRWGNPNATQAQLEDAARRAAAHDFVAGFPEGYETKVEQGGVNLSGGQRQRLCIARALLKDPKILILDDSTSAVDTATDSMIRAELKIAAPGTTKIIIAQRLASVMDADRIIMMQDGAIEAFGTHDELMATNEAYAEIYQTQMKSAS